MGNYALRMHFTRRAARIHNSRKLLTYSTAPIQENILCGENICCVEATTNIAGFGDVTKKESYKESDNSDSKFWLLLKQTAAPWWPSLPSTHLHELHELLVPGGDLTHDTYYLGSLYFGQLEMYCDLNKSSTCPFSALH